MAAAQQFIFRPAIRSQVSLIIGLIAPSGAGKTFSAMRMASGIVGPGKRFAVIDTEAGRASHYADRFEFDVLELKPPFRPETYADAIRAADAAGYDAIVVDSMSHEWAGEGGVTDWHEEELDRMAGDDWRKRESCKMAAWIKPKMAHKQMLQRILQIRASLILCFRAEEKVKPMKNAQGKTELVDLGFQPICSKEMPYELTASFLLTPDRPGIPQPIKLQEQHKSIFPLDQPINEASGRAISAWAKGTPPPNINALVEKMLAAPDVAALDALMPARGVLVGEDRQEVGAAYKQAKARLQPPAIDPAIGEIQGPDPEFLATMDAEAAREKQ
jgi:hypothetical protein